MASMDVQKLLQFPLCKGLTEDEVRTAFSIGQETRVERGKNLFSEGDPGDSLYLVLEGVVEISKRDKSGAPIQLARLGDGSVLGEMSLLNGAGARSATATAYTDARLLKVPTDGFGQLLRTDSVAALKVVHNVAQVMSRRLLLMDEKLVDLADKGKRKEELLDFQRILTQWSF